MRPCCARRTNGGIGRTIVLTMIIPTMIILTMIILTMIILTITYRIITNGGMTTLPIIFHYITNGRHYSAVMGVPGNVSRWRTGTPNGSHRGSHGTVTGPSRVKTVYKTYTPHGKNHTHDICKNHRKRWKL